MTTMIVDRRRVLSLAAASALSQLVPGRACANAYPTRPDRVVVGFPAGGGADILTRVIAEWLQGRLGQPFIVENLPGAGTNLATEAVVRAPADGYTLLATTTSNLINGALYDDLKYDFVRDIAPVASLTIQPLVLEVIPAIPAKSVPEFIAYAKANPGKINMGSSGIGTVSHLAAEAFKLATGIEFVNVPYRGSVPMFTDMLGGRVHAAFENIPASIQHIKSGSLRPLAVTTKEPSAALPSVPTFGEFIPGFEAFAVAGIGAPNGTPADIVARLNTEINAGLADPKVRARLNELGATTMPGSPADFARLIARETEKWGKVIKSSGFKMNPREK
jgi:tripartite-type tricarboxylate transporter receptor subunit TctC